MAVQNPFFGRRDSSSNNNSSAPGNQPASSDGPATRQATGVLGSAASRSAASAGGALRAVQVLPHRRHHAGHGTRVARFRSGAVHRRQLDCTARRPGRPRYRSGGARSSRVARLGTVPARDSAPRATGKLADFTP